LMQNDFLNAYYTRLKARRDLDFCSTKAYFHKVFPYTREVKGKT
jgi:hypothetical protein